NSYKMGCWKRPASVCASHREGDCCRMKCSRGFCAKKRWIYTNCKGLRMHSPASETGANETKHSATAIDLRSDTVTKPSPEMRQAMFEAEVGDDVYGEDPTINRLEAMAAAIFGREAALFVPSGTMGNQIAIKLHTHHGQEVICEERGHVFNYE